MEYFDFEDASRAHLDANADAFAPIFPEIKEADCPLESCFEDSFLGALPLLARLQ